MVNKNAYIVFFLIFFHPTGTGVLFQPPRAMQIVFAHSAVSRTNQARARAKNGGESDEEEESRRQTCRTRGDRPGKQRDPEGELMATSHHPISRRLTPRCAVVRLLDAADVHLPRLSTERKTHTTRGTRTRRVFKIACELELISPTGLRADHD